jgi:hypothetical protein
MDRVSDPSWHAGKVIQVFKCFQDIADPSWEGMGKFAQIDKTLSQTERAGLTPDFIELHRSPSWLQCFHNGVFHRRITAHSKDDFFHFKR